MATDDIRLGSGKPFCNSLNRASINNTRMSRSTVSLLSCCREYFMRNFLRSNRNKYSTRARHRSLEICHKLIYEIIDWLWQNVNFIAETCVIGLRAHKSTLLKKI